MQLKKRHFTVCSVFLALTALLFCMMPSGYQKVSAATSSTVKALEDQISVIESNLAALEKKITNTNSDISSAEELKTYYDSKLALVAESITATENLIQAYDDQIADKELEIQNKNQEITDKKAEFMEWMRLSYEYGDTTYLEMILSAENFADFLSGIDMIAQLMDYQKTVMTKLDEDLSGLETDMKTLEELRQNQAGYKEKLAVEKANYDQLIKDTDAYITSLIKQKSQYQSNYQTNTQKLEEINKELEEELERLAKQNAVYVGGEFIWPCDATKYKRISSPYGPRPSLGDFHYGIDIPCAQNADVFAANAGTVVKATSHYSYGNYVLIDHGGGVATLYAHNTSLLVKEGDTVTQGQVIAYAGNTGNSYGVHIHFEVRIDGKHTDPLNGYITQPT